MFTNYLWQIEYFGFFLQLPNLLLDPEKGVYAFGLGVHRLYFHLKIRKYEVVLGRMD